MLALLTGLLAGVPLLDAAAQDTQRLPPNSRPLPTQPQVPGAAEMGPPGIRQPVMRNDTPKERQELLSRMEADRARNPPSEVPPLPAQKITPVNPQQR